MFIPALDLVAASLRQLLGKKDANLSDSDVGAIHNATEVLANTKAYSAFASFVNSNSENELWKALQAVHSRVKVFFSGVIATAEGNRHILIVIGMTASPIRYK